MDEWMDGWMERREDEWMDGWVEERMVGWMSLLVVSLGRWS